MRLRSRYALVFGTTVVLIVLLVSATHVLEHEQIEAEMQASSGRAMLNTLFKENEKAGQALALTLAESLVEPVALHDFEQIVNITRSARELGSVAEVLVFDAQGRIIDDGTEQVVAFGRAISPDVHNTVVSDGESIVEQRGDLLKVVVPIRIGHRILGGLSLTLKLDDVFQDINDLNTELAAIAQSNNTRYIVATVGLAIGFCLLAVTAGFFIARRLTGPIVALTEVTRRIGRGQYDIELPSERRDELGELAESLRSMARKLGEHTVSKGELEKLVLMRTKELERANEKLRELDQARRQFLTELGHELRTPLTAIRGGAEVTLRRRDSSPEAGRATLTRIVELCEQLGCLVDDLMFIARSDNSMPQLHIATVSLCDVLSTVCQNVESLARKDKIKLTLQCKNDSWVDGDYRRLQQLFSILVDNAVKYSHPGDEVQVELTSQETDGAGFAEVAVTDTGIGMTAEERDRGSHRFYRGKRAREKHVHGMGLGLAIAKAIVRAHGADMRVESEVNKGTTVLVCIPVAEQGCDEEQRQTFETSSDLQTAGR